MNEDRPESVRRADAGEGDRCGNPLCRRKALLLHGRDHLCSRCYNAGKPRREHVSPGKPPTEAAKRDAEEAITAERVRRALKRKPAGRVKLPKGMR